MTVQEIIETALGHLVILPAGEAMGAADAASGLRAFEAMLMALPVFARKLKRTRISDDYTIEENERVFNAVDDNLAVTLPETIEDECSPDADSAGLRPPINGAVGAVAGSSYTVSVYIEALGGWKQISGLALTDANPLGPEHDEGLGFMLAMRLAPSYQVTPSAIVAESALAGRRLIRQRFRQDYSPAIDETLLRTSAWREGGVLPSLDS